MEIIKRIEGQKADKQIVKEGHPQISFNSDGRMVIRQIYSSKEDALIVLDRLTSKQIINFILYLHERFNEKDNIPF